MKVLIADDAEPIREILYEITNLCGFEESVLAEDGLAAFERYKEVRPDVVLLDILMPKNGGIENGIDALKAIIKFDPSAKVIMVSALTNSAIVREAMENGAKMFVQKPFSNNDIMSALRKVDALPA